MLTALTNRLKLHVSLPLLLVAGVYAYVIARCFTVSITHDEVWTILHFARLPVHDIVAYTDPIPNNHILNTLLVKLCTHLGGVSAAAARLPNVIGYALYAYAVTRLAFAASKAWQLRMLILCAFLLNTFLLDFFSLARGYGLSIDFMMMACWYGYRWMYLAGRKPVLIAALSMAMLGVYANFTTLNFFVPFVMLLALWAIIQRRAPGAGRVATSLALVVIACVLLAGMCYLPIVRMRATNQFAFWGSSGFYKETLSTVVYASLGQYARKGPEGLVLLVANCLMISAAGLMLAVVAWHLKRRLALLPADFFILLFTGSVLMTVLQFIILHTPYLSTRTGVFYYPLFVTAIGFAAAKLHLRRPGLVRAISVFLAACILLQFRVNARLNSTWEWWFDANTQETLSYLKAQHAKRQPTGTITLDCAWEFHPALTFYIETESLTWLRLVPYHKEADPNSPAEFYYQMGEGMDQIRPRYSEVLVFKDLGRSLFQLKDSLRLDTAIPAK